MNTFTSIGTILASVVTVLICVAQSHILLSKVPQSVPWAGVRQKEILSKLRACLRELNPRSRTRKAGYAKVFEPLRGELELLTNLQFGRKGMPYIFPDPGLRPLVMVPQEHIGWVCDQPDNVLSARKPQVRFFNNHSHQSLSRERFRSASLLCACCPVTRHADTRPCHRWVDSQSTICYPASILIMTPL